jgi:hypothetical protein
MGIEEDLRPEARAVEDHVSTLPRGALEKKILFEGW